jgi:hypothetical protein
MLPGTILDTEWGDQWTVGLEQRRYGVWAFRNSLVLTYTVSAFFSNHLHQTILFGAAARSIDHGVLLFSRIQMNTFLKDYHTTMAGWDSS